MNIAATTKISVIIKENPAAIEAIASISSHFEKLRNPLLRKILAPRVTIADAARIGGCQVEEFYVKLAPLGFTVSGNPVPAPVATSQPNGMPAQLAQLPEQSIQVLDVRADIASGNDPFRKIMKAVEALNATNALLIINTFEPTPLFSILQKKGFDYYVEQKESDLIHTYFWLKHATPQEAEKETGVAAEFDLVQARFEGKSKKIDVRDLEMPQPMIKILNELELLPPDHALYVTHRRVPQFLLPKLAERNFNIAIKEISPSETHLLIFK